MMLTKKLRKRTSGRMNYVSGVQFFPRTRKGAILRALLAGGSDIKDEVVERVTVFIPREDSAFIDSLAQFRNKLAKAKKDLLKTQWSRKSLCESFIVATAAESREEMKPLFETFGPLPAADDEKAMEKYVARVLEAEKKQK